MQRLYYFHVILFIFDKIIYICTLNKLSRGVIGNTSDSGSEEFRFET